jgi:hypothetical protein
MAAMVQLGLAEVAQNGKFRLNRRATKKEAAAADRLAAEFDRQPGSAMAFLISRGTDGVTEDADGWSDVDEYTVRQRRVVKPEDVFPTRTYHVGDTVFDLPSQREATILNIQVSDIERQREGAAEALIFTDAPADAQYGNMPGDEGRLPSEICLPAEAEKYRLHAWIAAAVPFDGNLIEFIDPHTPVLNEAGRAEARRHGFDPDDPETVERLVMKLRKDRAVAELDRLN